MSKSFAFALRQSIAQRSSQLLVTPALDVKAAIPFNSHAAVTCQLPFLQLALLRSCWAVLWMRHSLISALEPPAPSLEPQGCASSLPTAAGHATARPHQHAIYNGSAERSPQTLHCEALRQASPIPLLLSLWG